MSLLLFIKRIILLGKCRWEWLPPHRLKRKSLEFSHIVTISHLRKIAEVSSSKQNKSWRSSFQPCSPQKLFKQYCFSFYGAPLWICMFMEIFVLPGERHYDLYGVCVTMTHNKVITLLSGSARLSTHLR